MNHQNCKLSNERQQKKCQGFLHATDTDFVHIAQLALHVEVPRANSVFIIGPTKVPLHYRKVNMYFTVIIFLITGSKPKTSHWPTYKVGHRMTTVAKCELCSKGEKMTFSPSFSRIIIQTSKREQQSQALGNVLNLDTWHSDMLIFYSLTKLSFFLKYWWDLFTFSYWTVNCTDLEITAKKEISEIHHRAPTKIQPGVLL